MRRIDENSIFNSYTCHHKIVKVNSNIILVPPKIAHFDFGDEPSNYGDTASVSCIVTSGDSPINFKWLFDSKPISEVAGISTVKLGKRNSAMTIDSVNGRHAGNYTCQASNSAATINYTAVLVVNGIAALSIF